VSVIAHGRVIGRVGGFRQPGGISATKGQVAVIDVGNDTVTLIDPVSLRRLATAHAGLGPTHVAAGTRGELYVVDTRGSALEGFDTRPRLRLRFRYALPGTPYGI